MLTANARRTARGEPELDPLEFYGYVAPLVDRLGQRRAQHVATDLHAPPRQPAAGGELVDPLCNIVAIQARERDGAEAGLDVGDGPGVLLAGLLGDVGAAGDVSAHQPPHRAALRRGVVGADPASGRQR
jgi:hypothetical protein